MARYRAGENTVELERWASQLRKGALAMGILLLLRKGPRYGLELIEELERTTGLVVGEGTIYPLLSRLHRQGLLRAEWETPTAGHPRKYYRLTPKGEAQLRAMVARWQDFSQGLNGLIQSQGDVLPEADAEAGAEAKAEATGDAESARGTAARSRSGKAAPGLPEPA